MSMFVSRQVAAPPNAHLSRALKVAKRTTYLVWGLSTMVFALSLIATIGVFLQTGYIASPESGIKGALATLGNLIAEAVMAAVFWFLAKLFEETLETGTPFGAGQSRYLRAIAISLLAAGALQLVAIVVACALGYGAFGGFRISSLPGLELFGNMFGNTGELGNYAYLDLTVFLLAAVAWGLSFVFEYGSFLQTENDFTL